MFAESRDELNFVGAQGDVLDVDAREAECLVFAGEAKAALDMAQRTLGQVEDPAVGRLVPLLQRVRGYALLSLGKRSAALGAFEASLEASRERHADHELAMTLQALIRLAGREGEAASDGYASEVRDIIDRLGIIAVPAPPMP
jgi:hypothetical protein